MIEQNQTVSERMTNDRLTVDRITTDRISTEPDRYGSDEAIWWLHHELRGSLNALGLCVRVLEGGPPDREAREYAKFIAEAAEKIERLVAKLRPTRSL